MYSSAKILKHGWPTWPNKYVLDPYFLIQSAGFSYVIKRIWHSLTVVINFIKLVLKNVIKLAKGSLNNIFQDSFNIILSQQFTHDRSYMSQQSTNVRFFLSYYWIHWIRLKKGSKTYSFGRVGQQLFENFCVRNTYVQCFDLWRHEILSHTCVRQENS